LSDGTQAAAQRIAADASRGSSLSAIQWERIDLSKEQDWDWSEQDTVVAALARATVASPNRPFLDASGETYTYSQIDKRTTRLAHALAALGIRAGDTVVSMLDNNADAVTVWLAINKLCAISVPLNTALRGEFLRHQIADAASTLVICESDYVERIEAIADQLPDVKTILVRGSVHKARSGNIGVAPLDEYRGTDESPMTVSPKPSDLALLIYTSGTTGPSKGCMISFNYMMNLAKLKLRYNPATADDVTFTPLPLYHMNAVVSGTTTTIMVGGKIAISPRFSVSNFWPEVERSGATVASILGSMGLLLAQAPDNDAMKRCFGQLHTIRGNPFAEDVKKIWRERFGAKRVASMDFGLTEAAVVTGVHGDQPTPPGSSGKRVPEFDVRIVDDEDREMPPGQAGEIIVRPRRPHIMFEGYWKRPADTMRVMKNLWFHTGDIGKFDDEGFFYFVDRKKDYLRRKGENISSFEMETTFGRHPDIEEVAVHAVFSPLGEDEVKVTAVRKAGATLTEEALCRWSLDKVPYYAVPRFIEFRDTLPRNPQGKVLKYQLREEGQTVTTWDLSKSSIELVKR
jgi:crotonobetaine/carnitine-CoA ligase